jgi:hypothetical protein
MRLRRRRQPIRRDLHGRRGDATPSSTSYATTSIPSSHLVRLWHNVAAHLDQAEQMMHLGMRCIS